MPTLTPTTTAPSAAPAQASHAWWASLRHGGLLIAPSRLPQFFPSEPPPLAPHHADLLRRAMLRLDTGSQNGPVSAFLDTVLESICDLRPHDGGTWYKSKDIPKEFSHRAVTGEIVKPRRVWTSAQGACLPVFFDAAATRIGVGRGRRAPARVIEWLRTSDRRIGLLTNARQWRLIYAGLDHDAFAEWDIDSWFEEGTPGPQLTALRALLARRSLEPASPTEPAPLLAAIAATRAGQAELSSELGERVRQAVELLIRESHIDATSLDARSIYIAATRVVMRLVVLLFAESREDLLPLDNPIYHDSYGLQSLRESLGRLAGGAQLERLRHRVSAWPRLLGLFRLIHDGSPHPDIPVHRYAGKLFEPGDPASAELLSRALAMFERNDPCPNDAVVHRILDLLCTCSTIVRQGRATTRVAVPVDFSDLSSAYIGILYEGLLDFELRRAEDVVVFLNLGDEPALPLDRLEGMSDKDLASLVEKFKKKQSAASAGEDDEADASEEDEEEEDSEDEDANDPSTDAEPADSIEDPAAQVAESPALYADESERDAEEQARNRALAWARRAVHAGKLAGRKPSDIEIERTAKNLLARTILPGEWYLIRWGGTRKGAGTFYTRPELAVPTVQRTLRPLAYDPPAGEDGAPDEDAPASTWTPKPPEEILGLKVCDPACGSGSFLVASLRFLTEALLRSLHHHKRIAANGSTTLVTLAAGKPGGTSLQEEILPCLPEDDAFEKRLRGRLKRYVVEQCIYGVDIDPLAVELARLTLWIETMDRDLPFSFLDHKIRCGNSLIGCWFDRFRDYPALAWDREGGDKGHTRGVHFAKEGWTKAIKDFRSKKVKPSLAAWIKTQSSMFEATEDASPEALHDEALARIERIHAFPVHEAEERAAYYREQILDHPSLRRLRDAFDLWCSIWFWPADKLDCAPLPTDFLRPSAPTRAVVQSLRDEHRFFHWELEFPDVFDQPGSGFDAVMGNPPWDVQKPNSKEYFSNIDPLYRGYGKQEALNVQEAIFRRSQRDERAWLEYSAKFKGVSNFCKNTFSPFGDGADDGEVFNLGSGNADGHDQWRSRRCKRTGYADPLHPFRQQGIGDVNNYKLFLEQAHALLGNGGQFGVIVPSGIYTDKGTTELRRLFLERCSWQWLFGFENREKVFDIDSRFKFCPVIIRKGGTTDAVRTAFMRRKLQDWEEGERHVIPYGREQVSRFSPNTFAILELQNRRDLEILEKIYANSVLLGDTGPDGWGIKYATEFHMTNDSHLFKPRPWWEDRGYRSDEYGRWIKWKGGPKLSAPDDGRWWEGGWLRLRDGGLLALYDVEDIALPLYEGRMIGQHDFSQKGWVSGKGRTAVWREIPWNRKVIEPQFLMSAGTYASLRHTTAVEGGAKATFMDISSATNSRTMISAALPDYPCGNKVPVLETAWPLPLVCVLNSFVYDYALRTRFGGLSLNYFIIDETPLPRRPAGSRWAPFLELAALSVTGSIALFSGHWLRFRSNSRTGAGDTCCLCCVSQRDRLRLLAGIDAVVARLFDLSYEDFVWILRDTDCPVPLDNTSNIDPKGFWRVDRQEPPEVRRTVRALAAFRELNESKDPLDWTLSPSLRRGLVGCAQPRRGNEAPELRWRECSLHESARQGLPSRPAADR